MGADTFSIALFTELCHDFCLGDIPCDARFDPAIYLDNFDEDPRYRAKSALLRSIFKKSEVESHPDASALTLEAFHSANLHCERWSPPLIDDPGIGYSISYARSLLADWLEPHCGTELVLTMASIEKEARFGPGRSIGLGDRPTLYYFKVGDAPLTATSEFVRSWYELSVQHNPLCEAAEMARKARCGPIRLVKAGNLSMVPKSYLRKRIVVTEPSANTYFQLGAGSVIEAALRRATGIDLTYQPLKNSALARAGSIEGTFATVDLKQCSDYIALGLSAFMFPKSVHNWFLKLRTPYVLIDKVEHPLWMVSTMGNGFTFPLQTTLLTAVVLGVYRTLDIPVLHPKGEERGNYGVFGDDIVIKTEAYPLLCRVLTALGMIVNQDKSFADGPFRESCGTDWMSGQDVRGVYCTTYSSLQDFYSIFNRLSMWSARHMIHIPRALNFLAGIIGEGNLHLVPPDEGVDSGIIYPVAPGPENESGVWKYRLYVPVLSSFRVEPWVQYQLGELSERRHATVKKWIAGLNKIMSGSLNEPALFKSLLYGVLRREKLSFRKKGEVLKYRLVIRETPRWGYSENRLVSAMGPEHVDHWLRSINRVLNQDALIQ